MGFTSYLSQIQKGEDIDYVLVDGNNLNLYESGQPYRFFKKEKIINTFATMPPIPGILFFCFSNDNAVTGVSVLIKVTAIQVNNVWDTKPIKRMSVAAKQEMYLKN